MHVLERINWMMKNRAGWGKYSQILLMIAGACVIFVFYARYALHINTVWELPDEYGYIANAAYLSGTEWSPLSNMYYGWGYSLLLLPFFLIGSKGTALIRGAILVNALCTVATYWIQIGLISRLCKKINKYIVVLMAFVLSFYPYIMASNVKVLSEPLLTLMIWLCGLVLCKALETKHVGWYALLALCMAYTFFVHTRSFVFIGTWMLVLVLMDILKKVNWKHLLIVFVLFAVFYVMGYEVKNMLITDVYSNVVGTDASQGTTTVANVIGIGAIIGKIKALFTGQISIYLCSIICKYFYLAVATVGTYQLGVYAVTKDCLAKWRQRIPFSVEEWIKLSFVLASLLMICATTMNSPGRLNAVAFFFYGRYYEYLVLPVVVFGLEYFVSSKLGWKTHLIHTAVVIVSGVVVYMMHQLIESQVVTIDIFRMSSFSGLTLEGIDYRRMVVCYLSVTVLSILIGAALNHKESVRWMFLVVVLAGFAFNNKEIDKLVISFSEAALPDNAIVEYVLENVDEEQVYYLDGQYVSYTTRMQVLLGMKQLVVLGIEDLEQASENYLLVQTSSRYSEELSEFEKVMSGYYYDLYYID